MIGAQPDPDGAEQLPVVLHLRKVVNGWGESACGNPIGVLVEKNATCPDCISRIRALVTSEPDE